MARRRSRPDRPAGHPAWPARFGAAALHRVARAVRRAAEALAPAASSAAAAPTQEPPPRRPGQPPEHWLAMVTEHAPELLIGAGQLATELDLPPVPGYADPLTVPAALTTASERGGAIAAARRATAHDDTVQHNASGSRRAAIASDDRLDGRIHEKGSRKDADLLAAKELAWRGGLRTLVTRTARVANGAWERLTGHPRTAIPPVRAAVHGGQTAPVVPALQLTPARAPERFPAWSWVGPSGDTTDRTRPAYTTPTSAWPSLPAVVSQGAAAVTRPAVNHAAAPLGDERKAPDPWPALPDDTPLWTVPGTGFAADRLARLEREQAGG